MTKVVELDSKRPHVTGRAKCTGCGHEWQSVHPVGVKWLTCPGCKTKRGLLVYGFDPEDGEFVFQCSECEGDIFMITKLPDGTGPVVTCVSCGSIQEGWQ